MIRRRRFERKHVGGLPFSFWCLPLLRPSRVLRWQTHSLLVTPGYSYCGFLERG